MALRESTLQRLRAAAQFMSVALIVSELLTLFEVLRGAQPFYVGVHLARLLALFVSLWGVRVLDRADIPAPIRLWQARLGILALACCIAFQECYYWPARADSVLPAGLSRVSLMASLTPVLIPDSLWRSLAFSVILLFTIPIAHWFSLIFGHDPLPAFDLFLIMMRHFVSVGAAWMAAATVTRGTFLRIWQLQIDSQVGSGRFWRSLGGRSQARQAQRRHQVDEPRLRRRYGRSVFARSRDSEPVGVSSHGAPF